MNDSSPREALLAAWTAAGWSERDFEDVLRNATDDGRPGASYDPTTGKIIPPEDLSSALAQALHDSGMASERNAHANAESLLYSVPFQAYLRERAAYAADRASAPTEKGQDAREPREPLQVECHVVVDISSPHAAADALSRVPINAKVQYSTQSALMGLVTMGRLVATWTEER